MSTLEIDDVDFEDLLDNLTLDDVAVVEAAAAPPQEQQVPPIPALADDPGEPPEDATEDVARLRFKVAATDEGNLQIGTSSAALNFAMAEQEIARRFAENPAAFTIKNLLDIGEHAFKASGQAKKQDQAEDSSKFVLNINFSGGRKLRIEKQVEGTVVADTPESLTEEANTLVCTLNTTDDADKTEET